MKAESSIFRIQGSLEALSDNSRTESSKITVPGILFAPQNGVWPAAIPWTPAYPRIPAKDILGYR